MQEQPPYPELLAINPYPGTDAWAPTIEAPAWHVIDTVRDARRQQEPERRNLGQFVIKVFNLCNLACDYCYEYEGEDQSWQQLPDRMSLQTVATVAERLGRYTAQHALDNIVVVFHGGEPLMASHEFIGKAATTLEETMSRLAPNARLDFSMQTNGVLLTKHALGTLAEHNIRVGVSLDGGQVSHDRHRLNKAGHGTYKLVAAGIDRLRQPEFRRLYSGLLCTVDIANDPIAVYEGLCSFEPPKIDLLLPYATWDNPPPGKAHDIHTPYADWLIRIFDRWQLDRARYKVGVTTVEPPDIRFFRSIMDLDLGAPSSTEALGLNAGGEVVIRTDGSYELADGMKWAAEGLVRTGLTVEKNEIEAVAQQLRTAHQLGRKSLAPYCEACPFGVKDICGGGHIANRYSQEREFNNRSVYCYDLAKIIEHVRINTSREVGKAQAIADDHDAINKWYSRRTPYGKEVRD